MSEETQQDTPAQEPAATTTAPDAPAQEPAETVIDTPQQDPRIAQYEAERAAWREKEARYMNLLEQRNAAPQPPAHQPGEPDVDRLIEENFEPGKLKDFMKGFARTIEQKVERKYARREEIDVLQRATANVLGSAAERQAIENLRERNVPEADIKIVRQRANTRAAELQKRGQYADADLIFEAELGKLSTERMYSAAEAARQKKANVETRQQKAVTPPPAAPTGGGGVKLTDADFEKMDGMTMVQAGEYMRQKGL